MMNICYIVGAGELYGLPSPNEGDLVIAADGGYTALAEAGIRCDLLIGDMDSLSDIPNGVELLRHPIEKDETDSYLAYLEGVKRGYREFVIYGGTGGREDHTLANYSLLIHAIERGHSIRLVSEHFDIFAIKDQRITLWGEIGKTVSVFAFGSDAFGVSIKGLKYEADGITLTPSFSLGVSNSFNGKAAQIGVSCGVLLIMTER